MTAGADRQRALSFSSSWYCCCTTAAWWTGLFWMRMYGMRKGKRGMSLSPSKLRVFWRRRQAGV